ncbi:MAG TPA: FAD-dependent monooxygenase [Acidimicrobiales bacterium]|nr:FAD-dependent monooxygenase [Acidimicrobiales bacterium]
MYDAIIVGARCAGSAAGLLLARRERRVLVVDRATFPSDAFSTHFVTPTGTALLDRWGVVEPLKARGVPMFGALHMNVAGNRLTTEDVGIAPDPSCSPRRTDLDTTLAEAAGDAGAEVRLGVSVTDVLRDDAGRVNGVRLRDASGAVSEERASVVIGADGRTSIVARSVAPAERDRHDIKGTGLFAYFDDFDWRSTEISLFDGTFIFVFPTAAQSACIGSATHIDNDAEVRADPEAYFWKVLAQDAELAERVRAATRDGRWRLGELPHGWFRHSAGPGWALIGDAAALKDPLPGHGITDSFLGAELLSQAIDEGLGDPAGLDESLSTYDSALWSLLRPVYEATVEASTYDWDANTALMKVAGVAELVRNELAIVKAGGPWLREPAVAG